MDSILHGDFDAVDLITPTPTHSELGIEAMRSGKDLFVEKPMAQTASEALVLDAFIPPLQRLPVDVGHDLRQGGASGRYERLIQGRRAIL
jgi:predicted dehydrogenase